MLLLQAAFWGLTERNEPWHLGGEVAAVGITICHLSVYTAVVGLGHWGFHSPHLFKVAYQHKCGQTQGHVQDVAICSSFGFDSFSFDNQMIHLSFISFWLLLPLLGHTVKPTSNETAATLAAKLTFDERAIHFGTVKMEECNEVTLQLFSSL